MDSKATYYCVILAGGIGSRLWPVSRAGKPKQFLDLFGSGRTLLQQTYDRFAEIIPHEHIYISTNKQYVDLVHEQLPQIPDEQILAEPIRRNTLPCAAWATSKIASICPNANIVVSPADQLILREDKFRQNILQGLHFVSQTEGILTVGIKPSRPDTGYGYIQVEEDVEEGGFSQVKSFTEKPSLDFAKMFMESGEFYWNTGLFLWNAQVLLRTLNQMAPEYIHEINMQAEHEHKGLNEYLPNCFSTLPNLSLDFGVLERCREVYVQIGSFGWADLGNWWSIHDDASCDDQGNVVLDSEVMFYQSSGNVVKMPKGRIAIIDGLNNFVVAEEGNVLMICPKSDASAMRRMMTDAQMKLGEELS